MRAVKGKAGRKALTWFDDFTRVLVDIAKRHSISPTVVNSRETGEPAGRFFELAAAFEQILYPKMRSPTPAALAKRLSRALTKLAKPKA